MPGRAIEVDYLVVGAGAAGMAFTDALIADSDATVLMVDRRHSPGGHWNDAYPFVRLHQPSAFYGVNSRDLGHDRIDDSGPNAGFYERATAAEICHYFQAVLADRLLPSGQVQFLPMTNCIHESDLEFRTVSLLTNEERTVRVRRKLVDARYVESSIPATHPPSYEIDDGVRCVPVNDLVRTDQPADGYAVIGAGKTAMDACVWLLANGVDPGEITWIRPRDAWMLDRATWQPREMVGKFIIGYAASIEAAASATSVPDLFARLEDCGHLTRLDPMVEPSMFRAAILSAGERDQLRTIEHVVRAGRVRRIATDRIALDDGDVATSADRLHVDCTADGLPKRSSRPIFETRRVTIQQLRETSPTFNAALIGYLEATRDDVGEQNALTPPNTYPNRATDWIRTRRASMVAQSAWDQTPDVAAWIELSRLNVARGLIDHAGDPGVAQAMGAYLDHAPGAIARLDELRTQLRD